MTETTEEELAFQRRMLARLEELELKVKALEGHAHRQTGGGLTSVPLKPEPVSPPVSSEGG